MTKVLAIDDLPVTLDLVEAILKPAGYDLVGATSVQSARITLRRHQFGLVLVDLRLPDGNGLELVREIRQDARHAAVPIIVMTAFDNETTTREALGAGSTLLITKPLRAAALLTAVATALHGKQEGGPP